MTTATNHVFDDYLNGSTSQSLQNRAIAEVNDGNWFLGRLIAVVAKPLPTIWAVVKHILFGLGNFCGAPVLNPIIFVANCFKNDPLEYPCLLSNGCQHLSLVLYFTADLFVSPVLNIITPNCYTARVPAALVQDLDVAELTHKKAELAKAAENLAALQLLKDAVDGQLTIARNALAAAQQAKHDGEQGFNGQITGLNTRIQELEAQIANSANANEQVTQLSGEIQSLKAQITALELTKEVHVKALADKDVEIAGKQDEIRSLQQLVDDNKQAILQAESELRQDLDKANQEKATAEQRAAALGGDLAAKEQELSALKAAQTQGTPKLEAEIEQLKGALAQRSEEIETLNKAVAAKETEIQDIQAAKATLESENSRLQELTQRLRSLPAGQKPQTGKSRKGGRGQPS